MAKSIQFSEILVQRRCNLRNWGTWFHLKAGISPARSRWAPSIHQKQQVPLTAVNFTTPYFLKDSCKIASGPSSGAGRPRCAYGPMTFAFLRPMLSWFIVWVKKEHNRSKHMSRMHVSMYVCMCMHACLYACTMCMVYMCMCMQTRMYGQFWPLFVHGWNVMPSRARALSQDHAVIKETFFSSWWEPLSQPHMYLAKHTPSGICTLRPVKYLPRPEISI